MENIVNELELSPESNTNATLVKVWLSSGPCGILVAVREDGVDHPPPPSSADSCPPRSPLVGLQTRQGTWNYRRAFGGCLDCSSSIDDNMSKDRLWRACNPSNFRALSDLHPLRPEACSHVSAARAWWVDSDQEIYALQLNPFWCQQKHCAPTISIFGGMDHCPLPLEVMGENELQPPFNGTLGCVYPLHADVRPLAIIRVPEELLKREYPFVKGGRWTDYGSKWEVLEKEAKWSKPRQQGDRQSTVPGLCLIGDSHFERNIYEFPKLAKSMLGLDRSGVELAINFMVSAGFDAPARHNVSVKEDMELCHEWLNARAPGTGAIILSVGSHQPRASIKHLLSFIQDLEHFLKDQPRKHCVLVSPTLDSCHGNIPPQFHTQQRLAQNTWREEAKAAATQAAIEESSLKNLHFVDLFSPSAALHFGHCANGDPVHWTNGVFYHEHFRILFDAVRQHCGQHP